MNSKRQQMDSDEQQGDAGKDRRDRFGFGDKPGDVQMRRPTPEELARLEQQRKVSRTEGKGREKQTGVGLCS